MARILPSASSQMRSRAIRQFIIQIGRRSSPGKARSIPPLAGSDSLYISPRVLSSSSSAAAAWIVRPPGRMTDTISGETGSDRPGPEAEAATAGGALDTGRQARNTNPHAITIAVRDTVPERTLLFISWLELAASRLQ